MVVRIQICDIRGSERLSHICYAPSGANAAALWLQRGNKILHPCEANLMQGTIDNASGRSIGSFLKYNFHRRFVINYNAARLTHSLAPVPAQPYLYALIGSRRVDKRPLTASAQGTGLPVSAKIGVICS